MSTVHLNSLSQYTKS